MKLTPKILLKQATVSDMSPDEISTWIHLANGLTVKQICEQLGASMRHVLSHRRRVFCITGSRNLADVTRAAIRHGVITA